MPLFADSGELDGTALTLSTPLVRPGQCGTPTRCNVIDLRLARSNHSAGFLAGCLARHILKRSDFLRGRPIFSRPSGNRLHVMLSLFRQFAFPRVVQSCLRVWKDLYVTQVKAPCAPGQHDIAWNEKRLLRQTSLSPGHAASYRNPSGN